MKRVGGFSAPLAGMKANTGMKRWTYGWRKGGDPMKKENKKCNWEKKKKKKEKLKSDFVVFHRWMLVGEVKTKMRSNEKRLFFDWPHCVFVWIATHHFIIEETHTHTHTHTHQHTHSSLHTRTHSDDYHTPYYGCTDNCLAPMGLPIHCNPSNTLNFHFKQKLNCQKTQGSILLPPLCLFFFLFLSPASFLSSSLYFLPRVPTTCSRFSCLLHLWNSISEW